MAGRALQKLHPTMSLHAVILTFAETDPDGKKCSYPGINWADPAPVLFTNNTEDGGSGGGNA